MRYEQDIRSGHLTLDISYAQRPLEELLAFASRENPRRSFYFISRVMGKHLAVRPRTMRETYRLLADKLQSHRSEPTLVVGMAEAATGLGAGVADSLVRRLGGGENHLYMHTTRSRLGFHPLLEFDESHSHAPKHMLYAPSPENQALFDAVEHLVLVDDEITSGRTITLLAHLQRKVMPTLKRVTFLSLVNWLDKVKQEQYVCALQAEGLQSSFSSLLTGSFLFRPNIAYQGQFPENVESDYGQPGYRADTGRCGLSMERECTAFPPLQLSRKEPLLIIGNGEFMYQPFLLAEALEDHGHDVMFLSTTRTPILVGDAVQSRIAFPSRCLEQEATVNYLYNMPSGRKLISCYENRYHAAQHGLDQKVSCQTLNLLPQPSLIEEPAGVD